MSYQVIARKYRPQRFRDVVGQEHVTQTLSNAIAQNRIAHAYLFVGPRGTGKTTIARIFAKCLNCQGGPKVDFADDDPRCQEISEGRSLDVLEIDGASNRGIEEIRALRDTVKYGPSSSRFKIYIIDEVHMLTKEAFNALLKTLEEPPAHAKFMFATTEPEKVLATILSRCQRFDLRRIPVALIVKHLAHIAQLEQVQIEEPALYAIARGSEGCMRDAESTLDQLISFCGDRIQEPDVLAMFGLASRGQIHSLAGAVLGSQVEQALRTLDDLASTGKDLGRLVSDLLNHFRNLLLFQLAKSALDTMGLPEVETAVLTEQAKLISTEALTRVMEVFSQAESGLRDAASKRIFIEITLIKAIQARDATSLDTILRQLQQLRGAPESESKGNAEPRLIAPKTPSRDGPERTKQLPPAAAPASVSMANPTPPPMADVALEGGELPPAEGMLDQSSVWQKVVEAVGRVSPFTRSYLLQAHPVSLDQKTFTIGFDPEFADHIDLVDNAKNRSLIQTKLKELGLGELNVKFVKAEGPKPVPSAVPSAPAPFPKPVPPEAASVQIPAPVEASKPAAKPAKLPIDKEDFKNDPLIKQALEIFKGQIVEVRA